MRCIGKLKLAGLLALVVAGCDDESPARLDSALDGSVLTCQEADVAVGLRLRDDPALVPLRVCGTDADCTLPSLPTVACPERNAVLPNCFFPIATAHLDAGQAFLDALETELCPSIPQDCHVGISCPVAVPRCNAGQCGWSTADAGN